MRKAESVVLLLTLAALPVSLAGHAGHAGRPAQQQVDWATVEVKAEQVRGNIWVLSTDYGGNIGVSVGEDGTLIVDDQFAPLAEKIRAALKGVGGGDLKFILNTHYHGDHTGGNKEFGRETTIIAHDNVRKRLKTAPEDNRAQGWAERFPQESWPVITFGERVSIHFNGEEIRALHYPQGHTDGDSVIFFTKSNVVHMGDDFFHARFPYVDLDAGGNVQGLTKNVGDIIPRLPADVKIIPGHGPVCGIEDLKTYHRMLVETTAHVRKQKQAGKSLEEVKAAGVPEEWKNWGWQFISTESWLETVYRSLEQ